MTEEEKIEIQNIITKSPKSIWGYLLFIYPVILILAGILIHIMMFRYFETKNGQSIEIMIKSGKKIECWIENRDLKKIILTTSFGFIVSFAMLAFLAHISFKQKTLIKKMAEELEIID